MSSEKKRLKMALVAGAAKALSLKGKDPKALDGEIVQKVLAQADEILEKIDN